MKNFLYTYFTAWKRIMRSMHAECDKSFLQLLYVLTNLMGRIGMKVIYKSECCTWSENIVTC